MRFTIALLIAVLMTTARQADAAPAERLAEARQQYLGQEYERVIVLLTPLLAGSTLSVSERIDALELVGLSRRILGDEERARAAFERLLALEPGHMLRDPSRSPKLLLFFETVKARHAVRERPRSIPAAASRPVERPSPRVPARVPVYKRWWFWTAIGAVVVGASATAAGVVLSKETAPRGNLEPGVIRIR